jgi:hypothetical protein
MIKIGVTENVFISEQIKNDKGTLEITITEAGNEKKKLSLLEQAKESSDTSGVSSGTKLMMFMPSQAYQNEAVAPENQVKNLMKFKNQLHHFLKRNVAETQISWNPFAGIVIKDDDDLLAKIQDEATYAKVYGNIVDQFIAQATKFKINDPAKKSRFMAIRQSKEKSFIRLRDNFLDAQPFWESMDIPKDKSKLWVKAGTKGATTFFEPDADGYVPAFTDYEISKGFDNPIMSATKADAGTNTPEEAAQVEGVFGKPAEPMDFSAPVEETAPAFGTPDEVSEVPGLTPATDEGTGGITMARFKLTIVVNVTTKNKSLVVLDASALDKEANKPPDTKQEIVSSEIEEV